MEMNFGAINGKANAGLTTGIIGTALGVLNSGGLGGILGGGYGAMGGCGQGHFVDRFEAAQNAKIAELEGEIKLRDANVYTMNSLNNLRDYVDGKFARVEHELGEQRVFNATAINNISCVQGQVAQLMGLTKLVVGNASICPGWGDVSVSVAAAPTTGA